MAYNNDVFVSWFENRFGALTYSMAGSRNGDDGTADCSGSISQALKEAGIPIVGLPSTVTLGSQLAANGFARISRNEGWEAQRGDIILISYGADMSSSGGAGGHVGTMTDPNTFISVDYWTGGQPGTAVSQHDWNTYYGTMQPPYIEVWRYACEVTEESAPSEATPSRKKAYYRADEVKEVNGFYQIRCDYLAPIGFDWLENGIPVALVNWVDENGDNIPDGADSEFKAGMYFSFEIDEVHIRDLEDGGYYGGYYYRLFEFGQYGTVWLSTWDKNDLVNG